MKAKDFCLQKGLNVSLFYKWSGKVEPRGFVEVKPRREPSQRVWIECVNGRRVSVEGLSLSEVLRTVEGS